MSATAFNMSLTESLISVSTDDTCAYRCAFQVYMSVASTALHEKRLEEGKVSITFQRMAKPVRATAANSALKEEEHRTT